MELPKPDFISVQEAARELKVSEERVLFFLKSKHLTAYVQPSPASRLYVPNLADLAKAEVAYIEKGIIHASCIYNLNKNTMRVIGKDKGNGAGYDFPISDVKISRVEIEKLLSPKQPQKKRKKQSNREKVRPIAKSMWAKNTNLTIAAVINSDAVNTATAPKIYCEKTLRGWVKDLCKNPKPGRPKNPSK